LNFLPPYHAARTARLVTIEDKIKGAWDWAVNHYLGPCFGKIANDALHGDTITPDKLCTLSVFVRGDDRRSSTEFFLRSSIVLSFMGAVLVVGLICHPSKA